MNKKTTIKINEETRDELKHLKLKFKYPTMDDVILDACKYFLNYNVSPADAKEPISELFKQFSNRFFGAFNKTNNEILQPFIKDSYQMYNLISDNLTQDTGKKKATEEETQTTQKNKAENLHQDFKFDNLKSLILELDKLKIPSVSGGKNMIQFNSIEYNKFIDKIKLME
jgi:hypothetical protein